MYLHYFEVSKDGKWKLVQKKMNINGKWAEIYHWLSSTVKSFTETSHTFIYGKNKKNS
jgi:uncharacterized protein